MNLYRTNQKRSGLSLIEVLWSMGIVAVGLLGVLILLPVAGHRLTQGQNADATDRLARNATRTFHVRGMRNRSNWIDRNPTNATINSGGAVCIDPLGSFAIMEQAAVNGTANPLVTFPAILPTGSEPRMRRITLRSNGVYPQAPPPTPPLLPQNLEMRPEQAHRLFTARDDLNFDLPVDTAMPQQVFDANERRQAEGKYSWIATLTPKHGDSTSLSDPVYSDTYVLSVVVFVRRNVNSSAMFNHSPGYPDAERLLSVTNFYSADPPFNLNPPPTASVALNGGTVELTTRPGRPIEDLELTEGNWILLSGNHPTLNTATFRWYRVTTLESEPRIGPNNDFVREVTLFGRDWDINLTSTPSAEATILTGVVAVHEKTIRLESTSMWTP